MIPKKTYIYLCAAFLISLIFCSCAKEFTAKDYTAYFGGEVTNPQNRVVLFYKDDRLIDSLPLDSRNRFFRKFDSLTPGMYNFRHEPEYQYVYFEKNDSLLVSINPRDFDESIVFTGRGEEKNNFLMELYLLNERERDMMFRVFDYDVKRFLHHVDSSYAMQTKFYQKRRESINWDENFDGYARASLNYPYYSKKELYPVVHRIRTGVDVTSELPANYYDFRKKVNFNNVALSNYSPYVKYLSNMLNNVASAEVPGNPESAGVALASNTKKLRIADTLIRNEKIRNVIINNIAFNYLLEDQNMVNNQKFLQAYHQYSTDKSSRNEITRIGNAIRLLSEGSPLPDVELITVSNELVNSAEVIPGPAVIFFWTSQAGSHLVEAHKKAISLKKRYPNYKFIAVNVDPNNYKWKATLSKYRFDGVSEFRAADFDHLKDNWAITKIHRTIILDKDGKIKNAFTNLFDAGFDKQLESSE